MNTALVQQRLRAAGFDPGPIDGIAGRRTVNALIAYQRSAGLTATGQADAATVAMLFPALTAAARSVEPPWYAGMKAALGLDERRDNATIVGWAKAFPGWIAAWFRDARAQPWCGLAVGHFLGAALPLEPLPNNPLSALAWAKFGKPLAAGAPGAVLVFKRAGGGHVGFYVGEDRDAFHVLGGNQSDRISITRVARARLVAIRWPATAADRPSGSVSVDAAGKPLSRNEA